MSDMTEQEAWELDELLTKTITEVSPTDDGPFIKHRNMMVILDQLSAQYVTAKMLATKQSPTEIIGDMIRREIGLAKVTSTASDLPTGAVPRDFHKYHAFFRCEQKWHQLPLFFQAIFPFSRRYPDPACFSDFGEVFFLFLPIGILQFHFVLLHCG